MPNLAREEKESYAYYQLIDEKEGLFDLEGMVAYSLYKADKIQFIKDYKSVNSNNKPSVVKLRKYQETKCDSDEVKKYRSFAQGLLNDTVNIILEERIEELEELESLYNKELELVDLRNDKLKEKEKTLEKRICEFNKREKYCKAVKPKGFMNGVLQSLFASFILIVITVLLGVYIELNFDISNELIKKMNNELKSEYSKDL